MAKTVLVVGSGGREHALALRLLESPSVREVLVLPGNAGTSGFGASGVPGKSLCNVTGDPIEVARSTEAALVVVGPEAPLCDGLVDALSAQGILAYGPSRAGARLEASKAFMKDFAARHGIRTARHRVVRDAERASAAIAEFDEPPVIKADGLCAGKGVVVAETHAEAERAAHAMLIEQRFGSAGATVVIEERLRGAEASVHAICDGQRALLLPAAQDHKRIFDGDRGPNTGGMGTYAPAPLITPKLFERIEREIFEPVLAGMRQEATPYRGTLFAGLMITEQGEPVLLEFNVRFGDPETQVLMSTIEGDLFEALSAAARGRLETGLLRRADLHALCVVLAAAGYPDAPRTGDVIDGLAEAQSLSGVRVYHAGTRLEDQRIVTAGGRVLGVTASGTSLGEARDLAYRAADCIRFEGKQLRRDIGFRALSPGA